CKVRTILWHSYREVTNERLPAGNFLTASGFLAAAPVQKIFWNIPGGRHGKGGAESRVLGRRIKKVPTGQVRTVRTAFAAQKRPAGRAGHLGGQVALSSPRLTSRAWLTRFWSS